MMGASRVAAVILVAAALPCAAQNAPSPSPVAGGAAPAPSGAAAGANAVGAASGGGMGAAAANADANAAASAAGSGDAGPLRVVDGYKVDHYTMTGFRTWRAAACDRCHGANQEGLVGPSLVESLKTLSKDDFVKTVRDGRQDKGMISFANNKTVMENIDALYRYLKGRSDGAITRARVEEIAQ